MAAAGIGGHDSILYLGCSRRDGRVRPLESQYFFTLSYYYGVKNMRYRSRYTFYGCWMRGILSLSQNPTNNFKPLRQECTDEDMALSRVHRTHNGDLFFCLGISLTCARESKHLCVPSWSCRSNVQYSANPRRPINHGSRRLCHNLEKGRYLRSSWHHRGERKSVHACKVFPRVELPVRCFVLFLFALFGCCRWSQKALTLFCVLFGSRPILCRLDTPRQEKNIPWYHHQSPPKF